MVRDICRHIYLFGGRSRVRAGPPCNLLSQKDTSERVGRTLLVTMPEEQVEARTFPGKAEHMVTLIRIYFP